MTIFFIKAAQLLLCFCILILLHEGGHFFFAKVFGIRVSKFCLFFDPWIKPLKLFTYKGTEYCIGWLPLGGYVSIEGMVDESKSADDLGTEIQPWEFRAKPAWQRLLVMVGGVLVNFLLALFIYGVMFFTWGEDYIAQRDLTNGYVFSAEAESYGFKDGDIILATDGQEILTHSGDVYRMLSTAHECTVLRQGKEVSIALPGDLNMLEMLTHSPRFMDLNIPSTVDTVLHNGAADKAGIRKGDRILSVGGIATSSASDVTYALSVATDGLPRLKWYEKLANNFSALTGHEYKEATKRVAIVVARPDTVTLSVTLDTSSKIAVGFQQSNYKISHKDYTLAEAIPAGITKGCRVLVDYVSDLKYIFTKEGAQSIGSFGTIGSLFPATWDWLAFWGLTAFISVMLAFMNFLPIPALDGGYIFLTLIEVITRRKFSDKFVEVINTWGMYLLFALMAYAILNDFNRFLF